MHLTLVLLSLTLAIVIPSGRPGEDQFPADSIEATLKYGHPDIGVVGTVVSVRTDWHLYAPGRNEPYSRVTVAVDSTFLGADQDTLELYSWNAVYADSVAIRMHVGPEFPWFLKGDKVLVLATSPDIKLFQRTVASFPLLAIARFSRLILGEDSSGMRTLARSNQIALDAYIKTRGTWTPAGWSDHASHVVVPDSERLETAVAKAKVLIGEYARSAAKTDSAATGTKEEK